MVTACVLDNTGPGAVVVKFGMMSAKVASGIATDRKARAPGRL